MGRRRTRGGRKGGNESRRAHSLEEADKRVRRKKKDEWVERCAPTAWSGAVVLACPPRAFRNREVQEEEVKALSALQDTRHKMALFPAPSLG